MCPEVLWKEGPSLVQVVHLSSYGDTRRVLHFAGSRPSTGTRCFSEAIGGRTRWRMRSLLQHTLTLRCVPTPITGLDPPQDFQQVDCLGGGTMLNAFALPGYHLARGALWRLAGSVHQHRNNYGFLSAPLPGHRAQSNRQDYLFQTAWEGITNGFTSSSWSSTRSWSDVVAKLIGMVRNAPIPLPRFKSTSQRSSTMNVTNLKSKHIYYFCSSAPNSTQYRIMLRH